MKNWTDHIRTLAKFEDNIGKQVAFETSASMLDDLHKENDELKQKLEAAERERDDRELEITVLETLLSNLWPGNYKPMNIVVEELTEALRQQLNGGE